MTSVHLLQAGDTTEAIISSFFASYDELGYGSSEPVCCNGLAYELAHRGVRFRREAALEVF